MNLSAGRVGSAFCRIETTSEIIQRCGLDTPRALDHQDIFYPTKKLITHSNHHSPIGEFVEALIEL